MRDKEKEKGRQGGIPDTLLLVSSGLNLLFLSHRASNLSISVSVSVEFGFQDQNLVTRRL